MKIGTWNVNSLRVRLPQLQQWLDGVLTVETSFLVVRTMREGQMDVFAVGAFPAAVFFALILVVPESPRWLIARKGDRSVARDRVRCVLSGVVRLPSKEPFCTIGDNYGPFYSWAFSFLPPRFRRQT